MTSTLAILISLSVLMCVAGGQVSLEFSGKVSGDGNMSLVQDFGNVSINVSNVSVAMWNNSSVWVWETSIPRYNHSWKATPI